MGLLRWIDRHLWSVSALIFLIAELGLQIWAAASTHPVLLAAAGLTTRQAVYSSLTGSASALLGLALAVVAILVAFAPHTERAARVGRAEAQLARARTIVVGSLLMACFFMLVLVITSTAALAVDSKHVGNSVVTTLIEASGFASIIGLLVGSVGLALVVAERSR